MHFNGDQQITLFFNFWLGFFPPSPLCWVFFAVLYPIELDRKKVQILLLGGLSVYNSDFCV